MNNLKSIFAVLCSCFVVSGCVSLPSGIEPVTDFESRLYVGTWYEIARLDNRFERGLSKVTATYTRRADGGIDVVNRGYKDGETEPREATGKAYSVGDATTAHLKVSFFGPFYASYVVRLSICFCERKQQEISMVAFANVDR